MGHNLLQSVTAVTKCDKRLLQSVAGTTMCDSYYKVIRNKAFGQTLIYFFTIKHIVTFPTTRCFFLGSCPCFLKDINMY